jgi:hypothetical protein
MRTQRITDSTGTPPAQYALIGLIASSAPHAALLRALQRLRPQCTIRLQPYGARRGETLYRVELRDEPGHADSPIDAWLRIKSALAAEFPADKPHPVTPIDP